jgi:YegS/Rv2252/BmrU family lipid kinase
LIVNPSSGKEKARHYADQMYRKLAELFDVVEIKETRKKLDATMFAQKAADAGITAVFCMGGDGTANETINGLLRARKHPQFGFIPLGTVNDLARALKIPLEPSDAIRELDRANSLKIDIGKANERYFTNGVAIGTLPEAILDVSPEEKTRFGSLAYFFKGIRSIKRQRVYRFHIETDETTFCVDSPLIVVSLTNSLGSFERFMPDVAVNDGKMWLSIFQPFGFFGTLKIVLHLLCGRLDKSGLVTVQSVKRVKINTTCFKTLPTNVDGDRGPDLPLKIEILPSFLRIFVPAKKG